MAESFFHMLKAELVHQKDFACEIEATGWMGNYLRLYNHERLHSGLGYAAPADHERVRA